MCAKLAQLVRSLSANQEVPGSILGPWSRVELWQTLLPHRPNTRRYAVGLVSRCYIQAGDLKETTNLSSGLTTVTSSPVQREPGLEVTTCPITYAPAKHHIFSKRCKQDKLEYLSKSNIALKLLLLQINYFQLSLL